MNAIRVLLACAFLPAVLACTVSDGDSGQDAERYQAKPMSLGKPESDAVDGSADRTDWKVLDLADTGFLVVQMVLDAVDADVTLALFDRYGKPVNRVTHRRGDGNVLTLTAEVGLGKHFLMIQAEKRRDKTGYSLSANLK